MIFQVLLKDSLEKKLNPSLIFGFIKAFYIMQMMHLFIAKVSKV